MKNVWRMAVVAAVLLGLPVGWGCSKSYAPSHSSKKLGYPVWNGKAYVGWYTKDTSAAEFTVRSAEELAGLAELVNGGNSFKGKTVALGANIMLNDTADWRSWTGDKPPANAWTPIGSPSRSSDSGGDKSRPFNGVFRGNGFAVSGVYICGRGNYQGLFGVIGSGAVIESLGVAASYIRGWENVGGLVGVIGDAKIMGCYFSGAVLGVRGVGGIAGTSGAKVTVSGCHTAGAVTGLGKERTDYRWYQYLGNSYLGGLVGDNRGTVVGSYSTAVVTGTGVRDDYILPLAQLPDELPDDDGEMLGCIGGLVGANSGTVDGSYFAGKVTGHDLEIYTGGLVGINDDGSAVLNSYFIGAVTGCREVGGLVGSNDGLIGNSYSAGTVTVTDSTSFCGPIGGLVGRSCYGTVSNSYSTTKVVGEKRSSGGLVGLNSTGIGDPGIGAVTNAYYDKQTSGQSDTGKGVGKTTAEMTSKRFADSLNVIASISSMNAWIYSEGKYPVLSGQKAALAEIGAFFEGGVGTEAAPYTIKTKKQLENLSWLVGNDVSFSDKYIRLDADIALNDTANWQGWESLKNDSTSHGLAKKGSIDQWVPIGNYQRQFLGNFDGNGFTVSGVFIDGYQHYQGLFGVVADSGTVKNLRVAPFYVKAGHHTGGLAGENYGAISNCYSYGITAGESSVGGLVGMNNGTINACFSAGKAMGEYSIGGLVGCNYTNGVVKNSYSKGDAMGVRFSFYGLAREGSIIGGLVGHNDGGKIITSYSVGNVASEKGLHLGGFAGSNRFLKKKDGKSYTGISPPDSLYESAVIEGSYYDSETSGRSSGIGERTGEETVAGKSTAEMKRQATFAGWDFDEVWGIDGKVNGGYPYLRGSKDER